MTKTLTPFSTPLSRDAVAESFSDVADIIAQTVNAFAYKYCQDAEELLSEASLIFVAIHQDFDASRFDDYEKYVRTTLWFRLFDQYRLRQGYRRKTPGHTLAAFGGDSDHPEGVDYFESLESKPNTFHGRLSGASDDAQFVVGILSEFSDQYVGRWARNVRVFRNALESTLENFGWGCDRISETLEELGALL